MTTSLALLPAYAPPPQPSSPCSHPVLPPARPKLSLNTAQIRTFGKGSSLRLETLSAVSPTARNTFSNGYDAALGEKTKSRLSINSAVNSAVNSPVNSALAPSLASPGSAQSLSSASSTDSAIISIPYTLTHNLTSILSNSPIVSSRPRTTMTCSRPIFPAPKRVSFRTPLVEEIKTTKYTMAHSDLIMSSASTISTLDSTTSSISSSSAPSTDSMSLSQAPTAPPTASPTASPTAPALSLEQRALSTPTAAKELPDAYKHRRGRKRDSSESESESDTCPETPVAGRRKRNRDWVWTLGPLRTTNGTAKDAHSSSTEASDASDISDSSDIWHSDASTSTDWHDDDDVKKETI